VIVSCRPSSPTSERTWEVSACDGRFKLSELPLPPC
jgi:hypothetical protein